MIDRETNIRRTDEFFSKVISLWQLWLVLAAGIVAGINFYNTVNRLSEDQKTAKVNAESRRDKNREDMEDIRTRLTKVESDISWIKYELPSLRK